MQKLNLNTLWNVNASVKERKHMNVKGVIMNIIRLKVVGVLIADGLYELATDLTKT